MMTVISALSWQVYLFRSAVTANAKQSVRRATVVITVLLLRGPQGLSLTRDCSEPVHSWSLW